MNPYKQTPNHESHLFSPPSSYRRWIAEFIRALFDFSFAEVITLKMLPLMYGLAIIALFVGTLALSFEIFTYSIWRGIAYLIFVAPIFFIFGMAAVRSILEFFSAVFRMQALMVGMNSGLEKLEQQMSQLSGQMTSLNQHIVQMSNHMEQMRKDFSSVMEVMENIEELTDRIPFMKKQRKPTRDQWAESSFTERPEPKPPTQAK